MTAGSVGRAQASQGIIVVEPAARAVLASLAAHGAASGGYGYGGSSPPPSPQGRKRSGSGADGAMLPPRGPGGGADGAGGQRPRSVGVAAKNGGVSTGPWERTTLFGGEKVVTNPNCRKGSAVTFRRPSSSRATPHRRPIFVASENGSDARICVDIHAPKRFSSFERGRYEALVKAGSREAPLPLAASQAWSYSQRTATPEAYASQATSLCGSRMGTPLPATPAVGPL